MKEITNEITSLDGARLIGYMYISIRSGGVWVINLTVIVVRLLREFNWRAIVRSASDSRYRTKTQISRDIVYRRVMKKRLTRGNIMQRVLP